MRSIALARGDFAADSIERAIERSGGRAVGAFQVHVPRRKRQAIRFAHDGAGDYLRVEIEISRHPLDDAHLLGIFASEVGKARLNNFEKLQDYGCDAAEMAGTRTPFQAIAQTFD